MKLKPLKIILSLFLSFSLIFSIIPEAAYASSYPEVTMDLGSGRDFSGKGYAWDASENTLTLTNARLTAKIYLPKSRDIKILLEGENVLAEGSFIYTRYRDSKTLTIEGSGTGSLRLDGTIYLKNGEVTISDCILSV